MQNAFLRRKIEEQQEIMRKRQEFQQRISSLAKPPPGKQHFLEFSSI